ncbi:MAG TPA: cyclopropane-fatty-acyl-phospholipid synthase family protein [Candidatus Angelobacter sp.]|jgi:cyclopropane-fatty-acyl-phospholipid synthase|nr:cyclopropane-fatty-acyl-phospholipid synthase family protein [Candidatus Angelobacter sp.]
MFETLTSTHERGVEESVAFLHELLKEVRPRAFSVRLWEGTIVPATEGQPTRFTLVIRNPGALRRMFSNPTELALGEAYIYDDYDVEGDIEAAVMMGKALSTRLYSLRDRLLLGSLLRRLPDVEQRRNPARSHIPGRLHSQKRDRKAVQFHYDVSNEFYQQFLDSRMMYSEAYFANLDDDLDSAQVNKLERICRALRLQPGERLLDIGCGWGGLILYAAEKYGVEATGITLSEQQAALARDRIRRAGLENRCRVELRDYRELEDAGRFNKIASIGMVEHVGAKKLFEYFRRICRLLRPDGLFLNSGISRSISPGPPREASFIDNYVFPDGELEPIHEILCAAETAGFEVRSTENLREHYGLTLRWWVKRLEEHAAEVRRITNDFTYRVWRLYMAGSAARFLSGGLNVFHTVLAPDRDGCER